MATITTTETIALEKHFAKVGRREFNTQVQHAARKAMAGLPSAHEVDRAHPSIRPMLGRICELAEASSRIHEIDDDQALIALVSEIAWARQSMELVAALVASRPGGGGGGSGGGSVTCVTECQREYDQCINENSCDTSGWICFCCTPCSLQYMGCIAGCVTGVLDFNFGLARQ